MGHSTSSGRNGGAQRELMNDNQLVRGAQNLINYNLMPGWESARVTGLTDIGDGRVRIEYSGTVRVPYGRDPETGREEYGYESDSGEREASIEELRRRAR